ncbi:maleylpyruvate isomerase family mycothiol-dependent enzyme [Saccharothrix obliqua]|uniref:maleylpyruvate isomerase family mycothiol-dependent enzyme n=1 Tax=Saccharothrix obliqua TaxID=2861747 RepID=UPI001C5F134F|nr:maleylpyruvate isomerase family mycothiol-dependent enzyme [Saccharothrix obliqua]MBW4720453.1 maleylpyruvate isomerase family mycothiol-dependent enzyme [Saccharothrix obliqua]
MAVGFDRYRTEILAQTELLRATTRGGDPAVRVPTCPDWNVGQLLRHVVGVQTWIGTIVGTRSTEPVSDDVVNDLDAYANEDLAVVDGVLAAGAARLADALREVGPDERVWSVVDGETETTPVFWARRAMHETALHRADAAFALGRDYALDPDVARDGVDEWMVNGSVPEAYEGVPDLLGPGRSLCFRASDDDASWFVDLTGSAPVWRRGAGEAAATARGPLVDLLLLLYRRPAAGVEVTGDADLLERWLDSTGFWLRIPD